MNQPSKPRRAESIARKLAYAERQRSELTLKLHQARPESDPLFVGEEVGSILSACRECFDYAARDICGAFVPTGKKSNNEYFPFRQERLDNGPIGKTKSSHPQVYAYFAHLTSSIEADAPIAGTIFHYGLVRELNDLVNEKKHDDTTEVRVRANSATRIEFGGSSVVMSPVFSAGSDGKFDFGDDQLDAPEVSAPKDVDVHFVSEHRLRANNWEVSRYCMHAIGATRRILSDLYQSLFGITPETFDPRQYLLSAKEKAYEAAVSACAPIVHRLTVLGLKLKGNTQLVLRYSFEGEADVEDGPASDFAQDAWAVFEQVVLPRVVEPQLQSVMRERLVELAKSPSIPRHAEVVVDLNTPKTLRLDRDVSYDTVVFGVSTRFKHQNAASRINRSHVLSAGEAETFADQVFGIATQWRTVVGARPIYQPPQEST